MPLTDAATNRHVKLFINFMLLRTPITGMKGIGIMDW